MLADRAEARLALQTKPATAAGIERPEPSFDRVGAVQRPGIPSRRSEDRANSRLSASSPRPRRRRAASALRQIAQATARPSDGAPLPKDRPNLPRQSPSLRRGGRSPPTSSRSSIVPTEAKRQTSGRTAPPPLAACAARVVQSRFTAMRRAGRARERAHGIFDCGRHRRHFHRRGAAPFDRRSHRRQGADHAYDLLEGFFKGVANVLKAAHARAARRRRRRGACHHHRHQRADRAQGQGHGADRHRGIPRRPHIRNEHRYEMYDPQIEFPDPLVPSEMTFGVAERVRANGDNPAHTRSCDRSRHWRPS